MNPASITPIPLSMLIASALGPPDSVWDWLNQGGLVAAGIIVTVVLWRKLNTAERKREELTREMLTAIHGQSEATHSLVNELRSRPCQLPKQ